MLYKLSFGLFLLALTACQVSSKHEISAPPAHYVAELVPTREETPSTSGGPTPTTLPSTNMVMGSSPKVGLILGPGALRAFAHVGVVQEFAKMKIPIQAVVGIEMGALVAAIYANKGLPYDVEWQMMKIKESDLVQKGLLSDQVTAGNVKSLEEFMNIALSSAKAENSKVAFGCPAYNMTKAQSYMMNRGVFSQMLPFCLSFPPLFKPFQQNISGVMELKAAVDYVRMKGATYVIYVDLLSGPPVLKSANVESQILWSLTAKIMATQEKGLDYIIHVPVQEYDLLDFGHRREMIQSGQRAAAEAFVQISKKLGL